METVFFRASAFWDLPTIKCSYVENSALKTMTLYMIIKAGMSLDLGEIIYGLAASLLFEKYLHSTFIILS